jgi:uncharacterized protein (TIGR02246 family)
MNWIFSSATKAILLSILLSPVAVRADDDVKALEKAMWQAWAKHDLAIFEERLADDHVHVSASGIIAGKAANLADMKDACEVRSWKLGDIKVQQLGSDAALLSYEADQDATCGGEKSPAHVYVTVVWKKTGGKWVNSSYHETGAKD